MKVPFIDRIWIARGTLELDELINAREAFGRLAPLFDPQEVELDSSGTRLSYRKANPEAQHKLATFSSGTLEFQTRDDTARIAYRVRSPALLLTFLAPLLFLALGQAIVGIGMVNQAVTAEEKEDEDEEPGELHWIDQMLGAPAPEKDEDNDEEDDEEEDEDHSPLRAYGLAGVFALIYLIGRVLEPRLFRSTLSKALSGEEEDLGESPKNSTGRTPST